MEALHVLAVAPAAVGTCCAAADRGRIGAHRTDLAASILMTVAMADAALLHIVPVLWWALALGVAAVAAAITSRVRQGARRARSGTSMSVHAGIGMVVMAGLMLMMAGGHTDALPAAHGGHDHGGSLALVGVAAACAYGAASVFLALRARKLERTEYFAMGASTVLMGFAAIL